MLRTGLLSNMASSVGSWITPSIKEPIFKGSSSALHPHKLASVSVISDGSRRSGSSGPKSPARRQEERALYSTNKQLPEPDVVVRPQDLKNTPELEPMSTKQLQQDHDLAEKLLNDELLAHSIHEANSRVHSSEQSDLILAINLAGGSIKDYTAFTRQESETQEAVLLTQNRLISEQAQRSADRQVALDLQRFLDTDLKTVSADAQQ